MVVVTVRDPEEQEKASPGRLRADHTPNELRLKAMPHATTK